MRGVTTKYSLTLITVLLIVFLIDSVQAKSVKISGDLMLDHDSFDDGFLEQDDVIGQQHLSEVRRARLSFKTKFEDNWKAKLKLGFSDDGAEIKDAYLKYNGWDFAQLVIGQQKEGFGLEKLSHSRDALMIERSIVTTALVPGRSLGVNLLGGSEYYNWQLGYFQPESGENMAAITGRAAWLPWRSGNELVHLGIAFSDRNLEGSDYRINEKMEVHLSDSLFEGEKLTAEKEKLYGAEFLWQQAGFTSLAEWQTSTVTDISGIDYGYQGGYVQLSYQLSGDNRKYKKGELGAISTPGWEFTSRYSQFEMLEESKESQIYSFGVNYTFNKQVKVMANYIKAKQLADGVDNGFNEAVSLRVQYSF